MEPTRGDAQAGGDAPDGHYFDREPTSRSRPATVPLVLPDVSLTLRTDTGVFSGRGIDPGTKLLLLEIPTPPPGSVVVDVGCGYGPIACALAARQPDARVWAVDVNERALALCRANAADHGLGNIEVVTPDDFPGDVTIDVLASNPPIRIGKPALHDLLATWLGRLAPTGVAHLVVQRHLGADSLASWLGTQGWRVERRRSRQGYRVLDVTR